MEKPIIRVGILDDHQSSLDGYAFRLSEHKDIQLAATARFGDQLEPLLDEHPVDVLLLDVGVPTSETNQNPYPLLHLISSLLEKQPTLAILIISMHKNQALVKTVMEAGARGYIFKDDREAIVNLAEIIRSVAAGGVYFSKQSFDVLTNRAGKAKRNNLLTERQLEVLSLCAAMPHIKSDELGKQLSISASTMRNLLSATYKRLGVNNRAAAIAKARDLGLITPHDPTLGL